jgi:Sulfatase
MPKNHLIVFATIDLRRERNKMRYFQRLVVLVFALGMAHAILTGAQEKSLRPNIVYIVSDDQGWKDVGYHGSDIKTPNIDQLASSGTRLE